MKLKNHYAWLCPFWIISTLLDSISCVVNFVDGKIAVGFIFLILSVAFAFASGMLLQKALEIRNHNKTCDWLHELAKELGKEQMEKIQPFDEFESKNDIGE